MGMLPGEDERIKKEEAGWSQSRRRSISRGIPLGKGSRKAQPGQRKPNVNKVPELPPQEEETGGEANQA